MRNVGWVLGVWLVAWLVSGCHPAPDLEANETRLIELMARRLEVSREVAWTKFNRGAPVLDAAREQAVLAALVGQATRAGVAREAAERFFTAQIAASRQVQTELIEGWKNGRPTPTAPPVDLVTMIRPRLDAIGEHMVAALAVGAGNGPAAKVKAALEAKGFSPTVSTIAAGSRTFFE